MAEAEVQAAAQAGEAAAADEPTRPVDPNFEPEIIVFACHYCAYAAADLAGSMRLQYPTNIRMIKLPCTGKLEVIHLLKALEAGADGVYAAGCMEGECHYLKGNLWARKRVTYVKKLLAELGLEPERVEMYNMSSAMGPRFAEVAQRVHRAHQAARPEPGQARRHLLSRSPLRKDSPHDHCRTQAASTRSSRSSRQEEGPRGRLRHLRRRLPHRRREGGRDPRQRAAHQGQGGRPRRRGRAHRRHPPVRVGVPRHDRRQGRGEPTSCSAWPAASASRAWPRSSPPSSSCRP